MIPLGLVPFTISNAIQYKQDFTLNLNRTFLFHNNNMEQNRAYDVVNTITRNLLNLQLV